MFDLNISFSSGISGRYPDTDNVNQFRDNLYNKVDMISDDPRRWSHVYPDIPKRAGRLISLNNFDAGAFGKFISLIKLNTYQVKTIIIRIYEKANRM